MQTISYGPSQPVGGDSRIPRTRERETAAASFGSITHAREREAAGPNRRQVSRARESENGRSYKRNNTRVWDDADTSRAKGAWGGARNRRDRVTTALTQRHAEGVLMAIAYADLAGMPLTRHWIVDYELAGIADRDGAAFVGRLLVFVSRFARVRGGRFAAVWVREVGMRNGAHVHIAMHWPRGWKLGYLTRRWIKAAGGQYRKGVSRIRPVGGSLNCAWTSPALYRENLERLGNYLTKSSDRAVAAELGLELLKPGGGIVGKRWGRTQNLKFPSYPSLQTPNTVRPRDHDTRTPRYPDTTMTKIYFD